MGPQWRSNRRCSSLGEGQPQVWYADILDARIPSSILSAEELERAGRFRSEEDRQRFVTARGLLRVLLGEVLEMGPEDVRFRHNAFEKPEIDGADLARGAPDVRFNVSHSGEHVLVALAVGRNIGVDVEVVRDGFDVRALVQGNFSAGEAESLARLNDADARDAFFSLWTRKEAVLKAQGLGLSGDLAAVCPGLYCEQEMPVSTGDGGTWNVCSLPMGDSVCGACAYDGAPAGLQLLRWRG